MIDYSRLSHDDKRMLRRMCSTVYSTRSLAVAEDECDERQRRGTCPRGGCFSCELADLLAKQDRRLDREGDA